MTKTRTLEQILAASVRNTFVVLKVSIVAEVVSYDPETRTADLQPVLANATGEPSAPILDVPVVWPGGGGYTFHADLQAGDFVTLVVSDRSNDDWHEGVDNAEDRHKRSHDISDAVAFPVVHRRSDGALSVPDLGAWFGSGTSQLVGIGTDGVVRLGSESPSDSVALASVVDSNLSALNAWLSALAVWAATVTPAFAGGPPPSMSVVGSSKVRSD